MDDFFNRDVSQIILAECKKSEEIKKSNGYLCFKTIQTFRNSFFIYKHNYISWKKALIEYYSDEHNSTSNSVKRYFRQRVLITKIHNVLSSSTTFNEIYNKGQLEDSFHCFIKELRNFTMHKQYFPLRSHMEYTVYEDRKFESFQTDKFQTYLQNQIIEHPKWEGLKRALEFLINVLGSIDLEDLLKKYDKKMDDFYNNFIKDYIGQNMNLFLELIKETEEVHFNLLKINKLPKYPLSSAELRYLKLIINCSNNQK